MELRGLLARWLAHERPERVRQVVCLGSPWRPEGERTRTTAMFERSAAKHGLSTRAQPVVEALRRPLPVLCTAIYSKTDGVLNWRSCALDEGERCENVSVPSSHVGLVSNPLALAAIADRLAQDPRHPEPFAWTRCLRRSVLGTPRHSAAPHGHGLPVSEKGETSGLPREADADDLTLRDSGYVDAMMPFLRLAMKVWFRSRVRGIENIPDGGVLLVSNHSGGLLAMDVPVLAVAFHDHFGSDRAIYVLAHDILFTGLAKDPMRRAGFLPATRDNAAAVLRAGGATIVFPGGDHEVFRPSSERNKIDFDGRTGYVRTAVEAGVPIVPVVSIGGQEDQIHLFRGALLAKVLGLERRIRSKYVPLTFGFPFGLTLAFPPNLPLPTKIDTRVLEPIHLREEFGDEPDVAEVDRVVRARMQTALDELARARRFPVIG